MWRFPQTGPRDERVGSLFTTRPRPMSSGQPHPIKTNPRWPQYYRIVYIGFSLFFFLPKTSFSFVFGCCCCLTTVDFGSGLGYFYLVLPSFTEFNLEELPRGVTQSYLVTQSYPVLSSFTQFYPVLPSFSQSYLILPFYRVLPSFTQSYLVLPF